MNAVFVGQLLSTADEVAKLQEELEQMKPLLADAVQESVVTMQRISEDTVAQSINRSIRKGLEWPKYQMLLRDHYYSANK